MKKFITKILKPLVEKNPMLARTYRAIRDSAQLDAAPKLTPFGFKFIGNAAMQSGAFEPDETRIITHLLSKVDTVINVGANIGYYCCLALKAQKYVVAFEPIDLNLKYLLRNIKVNGFESNVEVFPLALSRQPGVIEIYGGGTGASLLKGWAGTPDYHVNLVPCSTLDRVLDKRFYGSKTLMIIDIEGAEQFMLEGAKGFINMDPKPIWLIEISVGEHQPKGVQINPNLLSTFNLFWNAGYEAVTADGNLRAVERAEVEQIMQTGTDTLHTHNFLFFAKGARDILPPK